MPVRLAKYLPATVGILVWAVTMVYPVVMVVVRAVQATAVGHAGLGEAGGVLSWSLFGKSVALAACGAVAAVMLAVPGAFAIGRVRGGRWSGAVTALIVAPLLFPPMVYALGWDVGAWLPGTVRCVWVWASWAWPVAALLIGAGWLRVGRASYEDALTSASPARAFVHAGLPALSREIGVSLLTLFAFFLGEYTVPHMSGLIVHATELLLSAEATGNPASTLIAALPAVGVVTVALGAAMIVWRKFPPGGEMTQTGGQAGRSWPMVALVVVLACVCIVVPIVRLAMRVDLAAALREAVATYHTELLESYGVALVSGVVAVAVGACVACVPRLRGVALAWALILAAWPGALVGEAVVVGFFPFPRVYDNWVMMVIGYVARFGWVGILAGWMSWSAAVRDPLDAARTEGASESAVAWRMALLPNWPVLAGAVFIVSALSLSEVAATSLVRVPSVDPIALILIEKFHRFEDGMLVSLSLFLVAAAAPGGILAAIAASRRS